MLEAFSCECLAFAGTVGVSEYSVDERMRRRMSEAIMKGLNK